MNMFLWQTPLGLSVFLLAVSIALYVLAHALKTLASIGLHDARWFVEREELARRSGRAPEELREAGAHFGAVSRT